jgi:hypothetical protein
MERGKWDISKATRFTSYTPFRSKTKKQSILLRIVKLVYFILTFPFNPLKDTLLVIGQKPFKG